MVFSDPRNHPVVIYCSIAIVAFVAGFGIHKNYFSGNRCTDRAERIYEFGLQIGQLLAHVHNKNLRWAKEHATSLSTLADSHENFFHESSIEKIKNYTSEVINITSTHYGIADFEHGHDLKERVRDDIERHSCTKK